MSERRNAKDLVDPQFRDDLVGDFSDPENE